MQRTFLTSQADGAQSFALSLVDSVRRRVWSQEI